MAIETGHQKEPFMSDLIAREVAESNAQIVGNVMGRVVTRGELSQAFGQVANKANWKLPIDAVVDCDDLEKAMIAEAVVFFAGCKAKFSPAAGAKLPRCRYRVQAIGYYAAVGA